MRDALTFKNRMMKQFIEVKSATLAKETHVTSYLRYSCTPMSFDYEYRFRNAQLVSALEEIDTIKDAAYTEIESLSPVFHT